jgi:hypothetical protein
MSAVLMLLGLAGVLFGASLIARWALGAAVVLDSLLLAGYGLVRDVPERAERLRRPVG